MHKSSKVATWANKKLSSLMSDHDSRISGSIDVLISYKKGKVTLKEAVHTFSLLSGLSPEIAERFVKGMSRDNIYKLFNEPPVH